MFYSLSNLKNVSFLWNDEDYRYIENYDVRSHSDSSDYVIVRKLFVQCPSLRPEQITRERLREKFAPFGEVTACEVVHKYDRCHGYVTFAQTDMAFSAMMTMKHEPTRDDPIFEIVPADTWTQPRPDLEVEHTTASLLDLNDDCLIKLCKFLPFEDLSSVAESHPRLSVIAHQRFSKVKTMSFDFSRIKPQAQPSLTLRRFRSILRGVGAYLETVTLRFHHNERPLSLLRLLFKLTQYCPNIKRLQLINLELHISMLEVLQPVLRRLLVLKVNVYSFDYNYDIDLRPFCPNLTKLKMSQNLRFLRNAGQWERLERLVIERNEFMETETFRFFYVNNPLLKRLKWTAYNCGKAFQDIAKHLKQLEKLTIHNTYPEISADNLVHLEEVKTLRKLKLMFLEEERINDILKFLGERMLRLTHLKLHLHYDGQDNGEDHFHPNQMHIETIARNLPDLQTFHVVNCRLDQSTVLHFIGDAKQLRQFGMPKCSIELTEPFIRRLVNAQRAKNSCLELLVGNYDSTLDSMLQLEEMKRFLVVRKFHFNE